MKITQQKGYPDTTGKMHDKLIDAQKAQSQINLRAKQEESYNGDEDAISYEAFIKANTSEVLDYIKYNCKAPKPKAKSKPKTKPKAADK